MMPVLLRISASALAIVIVAAVALVMMVAASVFAGAEESTTTTTPQRGGAAAQAVREACQADMEKLCPGIQPGGGRMLQCLRGKQDQMSEGCKTAFANARTHRR